MNDLAHWTPRPRPERKVLDGRYCRLEPLDAARHGAELVAAASTSDALLRYLPERRPDRAAYQRLARQGGGSRRPAVLRRRRPRDGKAEGRLSLMRIRPGPRRDRDRPHLLFGPLARSAPGRDRGASTCSPATASTLGYRRYEWKCNNAQRALEARRACASASPSRACSASTWWSRARTATPPGIRSSTASGRRAGAAFERWLAPANFDAQGEQKAQPQRPQCRDVRERRRRARAALGRRSSDLAAAGRAAARRLCEEPRVLGVEPLPLLVGLRPGARRSRGLARRDRARARWRADPRAARRSIC